MTLIAPVIAAIALLALNQSAHADEAHYYPQVSGKPAGYILGRLVDIGFGNGSGGLTVRTAAGKTVNLYAAKPPFKIDGKAIECPSPPRFGFVPSREDCPSWASEVSVGRSDVRVPYWRGTRYGKVTLVTTGFTMLRR